MVHALVFSCFLISCQIPGILHHHNGGMIPSGTAADRAEFLISQGKTLTAVTDIVLGIRNGAGQALYLLLWHADNVEGQTLGRLGAYTGKL